MKVLYTKKVTQGELGAGLTKKHNSKNVFKNISTHK